MLNKISNFTHITKLDLIMGYYDIYLTDAAKKVCRVTTPFVRYEYNSLLMGVFIVRDIFQERMSALMDDLKYFIFYLNDLIIITSGSLRDNLDKVKEAMKRLQLSGLKYKIDKYKFTLFTVEYLGYIIMREGIKPDPKKSKQLSILNALRIKNR